MQIFKILALALVILGMVTSLRTKPSCSKLREQCFDDNKSSCQEWKGRCENECKMAKNICQLQKYNYKASGCKMQHVECPALYRKIERILGWAVMVDYKSLTLLPSDISFSRSHVKPHHGGRDIISSSWATLGVSKVEDECGSYRFWRNGLYAVSRERTLILQWELVSLLLNIT